MSDGNKGFDGPTVEPGERTRGDEADLWRQIAQKREHQLLNLLARIHRDGGHYTVEHGLAKSVEDADKVICDMRAELDRWARHRCAPRDAQEPKPVRNCPGGCELPCCL